MGTGLSIFGGRNRRVLQLAASLVILLVTLHHLGIAGFGLPLNATAGYAAQFALFCAATPLVWCVIVWPGYAWLAWRRIAAHRFPKAPPCQV